MYPGYTTLVNGGAIISKNIKILLYISKLKKSTRLYNSITKPNAVWHYQRASYIKCAFKFLSQNSVHHQYAKYIQTKWGPTEVDQPIEWNYITKSNAVEIWIEKSDALDISIVKPNASKIQSRNVMQLKFESQNQMRWYIFF